MKAKLPFTYLLVEAGFLQKLLSQMLAFAIGEHPAHHLTVRHYGLSFLCHL